MLFSFLGDECSLYYQFNCYFVCWLTVSFFMRLYLITLFFFFCFFDFEGSFFDSFDFMKWIMVFIHLFVIVIIECACCHSSRPGSDHNILYTAIGKSTTNHFVMVQRIYRCFYGRSIFPRFRFYGQNIVFLQCFYFYVAMYLCTFYSHSISSVFMVLHCSCLLSIMLFPC